MKTLAFVGCNIGLDVTRAVNDHDVCLLFEPIQEVAMALIDEFYRPEYRHKAITVINAACWSEYCRKPFHLYNQNGLSSSLGVMTEQAREYYPEYDLSLIGTITVQCVKLCDFLPYYVDTLITDAQGADLTILRTIEPWLIDKRIGHLNAECDHAGFTHYHGMDNSKEEMGLYLRSLGIDSLDPIAGTQ